MAVLLFASANFAEGPAPRLKWLFYAAYPVHLAALLAVAILR